MPKPYTPNADDALFTLYTGVVFHDPGITAYADDDPERVDSRFFLKPVQDEILNLIRKVHALEQDEEDRFRAHQFRSLASLYPSVTYR